MYTHTTFLLKSQEIEVPSKMTISHLPSISATRPRPIEMSPQFTFIQMPGLIYSFALILSERERHP